MVKNQSMAAADEGGSPHQNQGAATASAIAFAMGGAALVSALVLYLTAPQTKDMAVLVAPATFAGGGGASLNTRF
jgi:hypothetical protein